MRQKIQKSMAFVITITLMISYLLLTVVIYRQSVTIVEGEIQQEADYICQAIEISGTGYLQQMDQVQENTRITWVDKDGAVLYDSAEDADTLPNHGDRPEIKEALKDGVGQDIHQSDTVGKEMYYYARRLSDGTVLRVSKTMDSAGKSALNLLPVMLVLAGVMILAAWLLTRRQVKRLIDPINELDLEHPLEQEMYPELRPLLERIESSNREKEAAEMVRKEFSANVSHELKTPLTSISGYAEIMKNGLVRPEDMQEFSERIYNEASRLITLVGDIIKLSRLDEERVELEKEDVELYGLAQEVAGRLAPQAVKNQIRVEVAGEPVYFHGIRQILDEMVYNIVENAIKYNNPGGSVRIWVGAVRQEKKIIVSDNGIGIPKDQQDRIFERFYRVDKSHSKEKGGTGLGLSIVKHGAILHGVQVHVDSEPGRGTTMELVFQGETYDKENSSNQ